MFKKFALLSLGVALTALPAAAQKPKVAIMDFGYATVKTSVAAIFGTDEDIGKGISDLLITQLLDGGPAQLRGFMQDDLPAALSTRRDVLRPVVQV